MKQIAEEKIGDCVIRVLTHGAGYRGAIIRAGKASEPIEGSDPMALLALLQNEAGKLHPNYVGIGGAIDLFLHFFPQGFQDRAFDIDERQYKHNARQKLLGALSLEAALDASASDAVAVRPAFNTNILSSFELARMHQLLGSPDGAKFVQAAAAFTLGDYASGLAQMISAIRPYGRHSWPMMTYLPNLWRPSEHMFLKPNATLDFAQRIGHQFQYDYSAEPTASVYQSLLDLVADTETGIAKLAPNDRIDVQSFIWVVGDYKESDLPRLEALRAELA